MNKQIGDRTKGKYTVSIGTSVALECFFGESNDKPLRAGEVPPYLNYQCIMANVRTMARNYISSYKTQDLSTLTIAMLYPEFLQELILIKNIIADQSDNKIVISYYNNSYVKLKNTLKKVNLKDKYTAKQEYTMHLERKLCELLQADSANIKNHFAYEYTNDVIRQGMRRNVIITHYPMDLLLTTLNVDLLESHTGRIKKPYEFPSKLKRAGDNVPFNKYTLQLLGDSSGYIMSTASAFRTELLKICSDNGINPVTQEKRFIKVVKTHASPQLRSLVSGM